MSMDPDDNAIIDNENAELERMRSSLAEMVNYHERHDAQHLLELERLREENETLKEDLKYRNDQYDGLAIRCDRIEEAARAYLDTPIASSDTSMRQYNPRLRDALRAALEVEA